MTDSFLVNSAATYPEDSQSLHCSEYNLIHFNVLSAALLMPLNLKSGIQCNTLYQ